MNQRGEGRLGCLVFILVLVSFVYIGFQTVPVYLSKLDFEDDLNRITRRAGVDDWKERVIKQQVIVAAEAREFKLRPEDIAISRTSRFESTPRLNVKVDYSKDVHFPGYTYTLNFHSTASALVGRF